MSVYESADSLDFIKKLEIPDGEILLAERQTNPVVTNSDGMSVDSIPPRTVVKLLLKPAKNSNINVEIWLPDKKKWNGRFLGLGNGGAAGHINPHRLANPLPKGYAVATTDMGTAPDSNSGVGNPEVWKDFGYRATHLMTLAGKQIVNAFYNQAPDYSYFWGSSTGGQQALQEAQRFPEDYDGIIANVPAHCRTPLHAYFLWNDQIFHDCPFTDSQEANVIAAANEYMASRELPQAAGKLVSDPRCNENEISAVICLARQKDPTLTDQHAQALKKLFDGPRHPESGERIFCGLPLGSSFRIARGHFYLFKWVFGVDKELTDINLVRDIDAYTSALSPYLNAENPDLSIFKRLGGKLLMASGSADSCVPYHATLDYYERVIEHFGSLDEVQSFFRFYIIPGMAHSLGTGPGITELSDFLDLLVAWREQGQAPDALWGRRIEEGSAVMELPIYPYPQKVGGNSESGFKSIEGPRGGIERVAPRFLQS